MSILTLQTPIWLPAAPAIADTGDRVAIPYVSEDQNSQHAWFYRIPEDARSLRARQLSPGETAVRQQTWGEVKALW